MTAPRLILAALIVAIAVAAAESPPGFSVSHGDAVNRIAFSPDGATSRWGAAEKTFG